jgi:hypothetical protein
MSGGRVARWGARPLVLAALLGAAQGCHAPTQPPVTGSHRDMDQSQLLSAVANDRIQFATMRPPGSRFAHLERRVKVVQPPEVVQLATTGDVRVLDELVKLLRMRERAWAAEVVLAAMTDREADLVGFYTGRPDAWIDGQGATAAERWQAWLAEHRERLAWDAAEKVFRVQP